MHIELAEQAFEVSPVANHAGPEDPAPLDRSLGDDDVEELRADVDACGGIDA